MRPPCGSAMPRKVGSRVGEKHVFGDDPRLRQPIKQTGFSRIRVADERDNRKRHLAAALAMQGARPLDAFEVAFDACRPAPRCGGGRPQSEFRLDRRGSQNRRVDVQDGSRTAPAAIFDRRDARQRPAAHLPVPCQAIRNFGIVREQIDDLRRRRRSRIALLYRRQGAIHDDKISHRSPADQSGERGGFAFAEVTRGPDLRKRSDLRGDNFNSIAWASPTASARRASCERPRAALADAAGSTLRRPPVSR